MKNLKIISFIVVILYISSILSGCVAYGDLDNKNNPGIASSSTIIKPKIGGAISIFSTSFSNLNPLTCKNYYTKSALLLVYESLTQINKDYSVKYVLASGVASSNYNKTWKFKLNSNVFWHSGAVFSPADVIYTVNYLKSSAYKGYYKSSVKNIMNVKSYGNSVIFTLFKSDPDFSYTTTFPIICVNNSFSSLKTITNGTGPYYLKKFDKNNIVLQRYSNWHRATENISRWNDVKAPYIQTINVKRISTTSVAMGAFFTNELDVFPIGAKDLSNVKIKTGYSINKFIYPTFNYLVFNTKNKFLSSNKVRLAIASLIERSTICQSAYKGKAIPAELPSLKYSKLDKQIINRFDSDLSSSIMQQNGWTRTYSSWVNKVENKYFNIKILVNSDDKKMVEAGNIISNRLKLNGFYNSVYSVSTANYNNLVAAGNFDIAFKSAVLPSDTNISQLYLSKEKGGKYNYSNYSNPELDKLFEQYNVASDVNVRAKLEGQIKNLILSDVPIVGIDVGLSQILTNRRIYGDLSPTYRDPYAELAFCYLSY